MIDHASSLLPCHPTWVLTIKQASRMYLKHPEDESSTILGDLMRGYAIDVYQACVRRLLCRTAFLIRVRCHGSAYRVCRITQQIHNHSIAHESSDQTQVIDNRKRALEISNRNRRSTCLLCTAAHVQLQHSHSVTEKQVRRSNTTCADPAEQCSR